MSMNTLCLKPINELLKERFFIPSYQRGYRWTPRQVTELLDDIYAFQLESETKSRDAFYCLQPVVVTKLKDGAWELIDGQQRLTTMFLILSNLRQILTLLRKEPYQIEYETRPDSQHFLTNMDQSKKEENIDYYHMVNAYQTVKAWFEAKDGNVMLSFLQGLLNDDTAGKNVKVIWYELSEQENAVDVFVRLNMGKIPLTNAELVRALLLRTGDIQSPIAVVQQLQIAQEWDGIEKALQMDDFWYFIQKGDVSFPTRIEYLFQLIIEDTRTVDSSVLAEDPYYTFLSYNERFQVSTIGKDGQKANYLEIVDREWRLVKEYFMRFEEWFRDRTLYHLIGFLITEGVPLLTLLKEARLSPSKRHFQNTLKWKIWQKLFDEKLIAEKSGKKKLSRAQFIRGAFEALDYEKHRSRIKAMLLFANVATLLQNPTSNMRFPFDSFKKEKWDIEHIRSIASTKPDRVDNQKRWIEQFIEFCSTTDLSDGFSDGPSPAVLSDYLERAKSLMNAEHFSKQDFDALYDQIVSSLEGSDPGEAANTLGNLTLLDMGTNRSYKNAIFPIKRKRILALDKVATFVPLCTTNVFLKYYSSRIGNMMLWSDLDRQDYFNAIFQITTDFFETMEGEQI